MEVPGMDEVKKTESHIISAEAFVEGGIQDACDDACSICLEAFNESDPSTVTSCKHEFHLQCVLEWCQRSSNCPMCWQPISLKDPASQELLEMVERERDVRLTPSRNPTIFHHPALGDFGLQHLPGMDDHELEERILHHLAAMGMTAHARPQYMVFSPNNPNTSSVQNNQMSASSSNDNRSDSAGPSDFQSISDTWKSRLNSMSMKYKESISKSTRGWKEKLFSRNTSIADIGSEVKNAGIATVSRMMERLETRDNNNNNRRNHDNTPNGNNSASSGASSLSS